MKRVLMLGLILLGAVYLMPFFTTGKSVSLNDSAKDFDTAAENTAHELVSKGTNTSTSPDKDQKVTVLISGEVKEMTLEKYLPGVLAAEIPAAFPKEALKAQAVVARTYVSYKKRLLDLGSKPPESYKGALLSDDPKECQAYLDIDEKAKELWGSKAGEYVKAIKDAVKATDGEIAVFQNEPIAAVFHAASSKETENAADVWGTNVPYLKSVESPGGDASPKYSATVEVSGNDFKQKVLKQYPNANFETPIGTWFRDSKRSEAGGIIDVEVGGVRVKGTAIREMFSLNSTNFKLTFNTNAIVFHTTGYGHGVGLSEYGARQMALDGKTYEDIVKWYYQGVTIKKPDTKK